jgi:hypothetical protein
VLSSAARAAKLTFVPIFEMTENSLNAVPRTTFVKLGVRERDDLQRLLRTQLETVVPGVLVIAEEFGEFEGANRRIDLLGLDRDAQLVVIELKRTDDGGHMELQALRYAAMVSAMTFDQVVEQRRKFTLAVGLDEPDSYGAVVDWIGGDPTLSDDVRVVLIAADFSTEITTTALWLTTRYGLDIMCFRIVPHELDGKRLLDVQQVIPLPEARDYQIRLRVKAEQTRRELSSRDLTQYRLTIDSVAGGPLSKQQAVKQAVVFLVNRGVLLSTVRAAVGNRWRRVVVATDEALEDAYRAAYPRGTHVWLDQPFQDTDDPQVWWVMVRVGGAETEAVLDRLHALRPDLLRWERVG